MVKRQFARESDNGSLIILFLVARGKTEKEKTSLVLWLHQTWAGACSIIRMWCQEMPTLMVVETTYLGRLFILSPYAPVPGIVGQPDVTSFPYEIWARLLARHARQSLQAVSFYQYVQGYAPLRQAIATHIGMTRGVHCSPEQIILTTGAQSALDLVARVLLDPGDPAWVEDPGYSGAHRALLAAGAKLVAVPMRVAHQKCDLCAKQDGL